MCRQQQTVSEQLSHSVGGIKVAVATVEIEPDLRGAKCFDVGRARELALLVPFRIRRSGLQLAACLRLLR